MRWWHLAAPAAALFALRCASRHRRQRCRCRVLCVIPARWASTRFPGKPLALIAGKPMIQRTWEQACQARTLSRVVVATDDERIRAACLAFGAEVLMTPASCRNGTARCAAAAAALGGDASYDIVINVQGDEPLVAPAHIDAVVRALQAAPPGVPYATAAVPFSCVADVASRSRVKVVVDRAGYALYFSRVAIPGGHGRDAPGAGGTPAPAYLLHLGLQCYTARFLLRVLPTLEPTPLAAAEDLEQLQLLEHGHKAAVVTLRHTAAADVAHGVDEPADVAKMEALLLQQQLTPSEAAAQHAA